MLAKAIMKWEKQESGCFFVWIHEIFFNHQSLNDKRTRKYDSCSTCSTAALITPQIVLSIWKLVELKMLDFSDRTKTGISILTSAADSAVIYDACCTGYITKYLISYLSGVL